MKDITIREYLTEKNIPFKEAGSELVAKCLFNDCDKDSTGDKAHLYFSATTGQYDCKKCGAKGNLLTLQKHLGDTVQKRTRTPSFSADMVEKCHVAMPTQIREYLHGRGLTDSVINEYKLGYGTFYKKHWITIPIKDSSGNWSFFKLRQDPAEGDNKITYPKGAEAQIYDWDTAQKSDRPLVICEGELDRLLLASKGVQAITSTHGAMTFKKEWVEKLKSDREIYVCFDNDEAGRNGSGRVLKMLHEQKFKNIYHITLPNEVGEHGDITDYFVKLNCSVDELFKKYAEPYPERVDTSRFKEMNSAALQNVLGLTIKHDEENKLVTFLCQLTAYTDNSQFNISFNAPSSTGKSFIPTEIARLFPEEDVKELAYASPTSFFHMTGEYDQERNGYLVDFSRKILIFLDQPHMDLLARLRPMLSHDKKEITLMITDKNQKSGMRTKTVFMRGYPSCIFCTAGLKIDEQEATRFLLLSPEVSQEKFRDGILATIKKESNNEDYKKWLNSDPDRLLLKDRIKAIKIEEITDINITEDDCQKIRERFLEKDKKLKPRHQRDIKRLFALVKAFALLNVWHRERNRSVLTAAHSDVEEAFKLWSKISVSQELNLSPYVYDLYNEVIVTLFKEKNSNRDAFAEVTGELGLSRDEVLDKHYTVYGRPLDYGQFRYQILPMLERSGLVRQETDPTDRRKVLIFPTLMKQMGAQSHENYIDVRGGSEITDITNEINSALEGGAN